VVAWQQHDAWPRVRQHARHALEERERHAVVVKDIACQQQHVRPGAPSGANDTLQGQQIGGGVSLVGAHVQVQVRAVGDDQVVHGA
jgi:hypothetical protein